MCVDCDMGGIFICGLCICVYIIPVCASVNHSACVKVRGTCFSPSTAGSWVPVQAFRLRQQGLFATLTLLH